MTDETRGEDPTEMRNQSALWTSEGTSWLVVGAIAVALIGTMFWLIRDVAPIASTVGHIALGAGYATMLLARFLIRRRHARLLTLLALFLAMLAATFVCVLVAALGA